MFGKKRQLKENKIEKNPNVLISLKNNLAFLAMTKTGSTSIETALAPFCDILFTQAPRVKHMQARKFERFLRPYLVNLNYTEIETTCLFRDPVDWLGSWYRYRQRGSLKGHQNSTAEITFDQFVESYLSDVPEPFAKVGYQSQFVMTNGNEIGITHLFRYEAFSEYQQFLSLRFGQKLHFENLNVSPVRELVLSNELIKELQLKRALDFEIHGSLA